MRCLAKTQGSKVRINAISPGLLLTEWVRNNICKRTYRVADSLQWAGTEPDRLEAFKDKAVLKKEVDKRRRRSVVSS